MEIQHYGRYGKKKKTAGGGIQVERGGVVGVFGVENSKTHQNMQVYIKIYGVLSLCYAFFLSWQLYS